MVTLHYSRWIRSVHESLSDSIQGCYPRDWQENFISRTWIKNLLGHFRRVSISGLPVEYRMAWDAYKATGSVEEEHGDIAILVRMQYQNGVTFEGAGLLEAKRMYDSGRYEALKWSQLSYQSSNTENHRVLLYDHQSIQESAQNLVAQAVCCEFFPWSFSAVFAGVVPTPHVLAHQITDRSVHKLSQPLGFQLCCRYLHGYDLDYTNSTVDAVKNGVADGIDYLVVANVITGGEKEPSPREIEVNRESFTRIEIE